MTGRLLGIEARAIVRSRVVWLALLIAVGGSAVARAVSWIGRAVARSELSGLLLANPPVAWGVVAAPLAIVAYLTLAAYVFGRDFEDGCIDLMLTAPIRRDALVLVRGTVVSAVVLAIALLGWVADVATCALLARSPFDPGTPVGLAFALGAAAAAIATLPVVAWASIRFRAVLPALGASIALQVAVLAMGGFGLVRLLPWYLPVAMASEQLVPPVCYLLSAVVFTGGVLATLHAMRAVDLVQ